MILNESHILILMCSELLQSFCRWKTNATQIDSLRVRPRGNVKEE